MSKAVEKASDFAEDEIGSADSAASLSADGGPLINTEISYNAEGEDEAWLDEELSDEELAALGEEDFSEEDFLDEILNEEEDDAFDDEADPVILEDRGEDEEDFFPDQDEEELVADRKPAGAGAVVAASTVLTDEEGDFGDDYGEYEDDGEDHRPVPRISIHAFCETADVSNILEKAAIDRRLSKTHLTMHMGGLAKAVDHFQHAATPNLVLIEAVEGGAALLAQLGELAEVCDPSTKVVIIGRVNDIALYRELMRQGISDYIVRPRSPLQIIKSISGLYVDPSAPPIGRTIAFVGARGGVGSSTLAHNVGWCAAEDYESDTVILDLDLPFGTASLDFEQDPTSGLVEALSSPERLDDVLLDRLLQKHTDRLSLFTAPNLLDRDYDLDEQAFETVIDVVRSAAPTIIIDVPHIWTSWSKRLLQTADEIVVTATSDLAAFRNTKNLIDVISSSRPNDNPPLLVINQYDAKLSAVQPSQYVEHVGLDPAFVFNWEPQLFHTASTNAAPITEVGMKTKTAQQIRELTQMILGRNDIVSKKARFNIKDLFSKR